MGIRCSASSALECLTSLACGLGTMPSADSCRPLGAALASPSASAQGRQASRGKRRNCRYVNAGFIKHLPAADSGLRGHVPPRPGCTTPHIRFLFIAPYLCGGLPSDPASRRRPCPFASPSVLRYCYLGRGLSPPSYATCPAHTPTLRRAGTASPPAPCWPPSQDAHFRCSFRFAWTQSRR
jgi:hypothetical protein